jgi:calpain-15
MNLSPNDIIQGGLRDCYFLSVLTALAKHPSEIHDISLTKEANTIGLYKLRMIVKGQNMYIKIDDYVPCKENADGKFSPAFSQPQNNSNVWVLLVEKARVKLNGSYFGIESGNTKEAFSFLSSFPTKHLPHRPKEE